MTKTEINCEIAKFLGWHHIWICRNGQKSWLCGFPEHVEKPEDDCHNWWDVPNYHGSLEAMHFAEKILIKRGGLPSYEHYLEANAQLEDGLPWYGSMHATSQQRAIAFLKVFGLYKEANTSDAELGIKWGWWRKIA